MADNRASPMASSPARRLKVFYDGACPLCAREVSFYRKLGGAEELCWVDVSQSPTEQVAPGLSRQEALARFHVVTADGNLKSGGAAFAALWKQMAGFRLIGKAFEWRPLSWCLEGAYRGFLKVRPQLQRLLRP
ncbi:MAG: DUF393 domain-containing protein [Pseudomonadota bacterium]